MVRRNLTGDEIQRYTRDSLCSSSEIKRLWTRFQLLDTDERGYLTKDVRYPPRLLVHLSKAATSAFLLTTCEATAKKYCH